jgi:hypothetical protein
MTIVDTVKLYTYQRAGHNITQPFAPTSDYGANGPYGEIAKFLDWDTWIWTMASMGDFDNDWFNPPSSDKVLWCLSIPDDRVVWCALDAQCENRTPVHTWFYPTADDVRSRGDIPQGLVRAPILREWVTGCHG